MNRFLQAALPMALFVGSIDASLPALAEPVMLQNAKPTIEQVDEWVGKAIEQFVGKPLTELRKIANLKHETTSLEPFYDGDPPKKRKHILLEFDGLKIGGFPSKGGFLIDVIIVTTPERPGPDGVRVGADGSTVLKAFGLPARNLAEPTELFSGFTQSLLVTSRSGKIVELTYNSFFD